MIKSTLGFAFSKDFTQLLLIKKIWPDWQNGLYNGIGGKIEDSDQDFTHCLVREFEEECGVVTNPQQWNHYAKLVGQDFEVNAFYCNTDAIYAFKQTEEEEPQIFPVAELPQNRLANLEWLVNLALDYRNEIISTAVIYYK